MRRKKTNGSSPDWKDLLNLNSMIAAGIEEITSISTWIPFKKYIPSEGGDLALRKESENARDGRRLF